MTSDLRAEKKRTTEIQGGLREKEKERKTDKQRKIDYKKLE